MGTDSYHCYLDTNTFLHYKFFLNIDWCKALNLDKITLIICYPVLKELEKHKTYHQNKKLRNRANNIVKKINSSLNYGLKTELRKNVMLELIKRIPDIDWEKEELSPDSTDDQIIAYVLSDGNKEKMIITTDPGLKLAARLRHIDCSELDDSFKLAISNERDREIQQLKEQLVQKPKLQIGILDGGNILKQFKLKLCDPPKHKEAEIDKELNQIQESILKKEKGNNRIRLKTSGNMFTFLRYDQYREYIDDLVLVFKNYFKDYYRYLERCSRIYMIQIYFFNNGNRPASNINISLNLPKTVQIIKPDDLPIKPISPLLERRLYPNLSSLISLLIKDPSYINLEEKFKDKEKKIGVKVPMVIDFISKTSGLNQIKNIIYFNSNLKAKYDKIQQGDKALLVIYIELEKENVTSFPIKSEMRADEIPNKVVDQIIVKTE